MSSGAVVIIIFMNLARLFIFFFFLSVNNVFQVGCDFLLFSEERYHFLIRVGKIVSDHTTYKCAFVFILFHYRGVLIGVTEALGCNITFSFQVGHYRRYRSGGLNGKFSNYVHEHSPCSKYEASLLLLVSLAFP